MSNGVPASVPAVALYLVSYYLGLDAALISEEMLFGFDLLLIIINGMPFSLLVLRSLHTVFMDMNVMAIFGLFL